MSVTSKGKIAYALQAINLIPLLLFGLVIMGLGTHYFTRTMYDEVEIELRNAANDVATLYDVAYPGDYELVGEEAFRLFKGEKDLTGDYTLVDQIKENTDLEVTLFYQNTRILTTIRNKEGVRIVGSGAPDIVIREVLEAEKPHFFTKTVINGSSYFSYYMPIYNSDGTVVGMVFAGKPSSEVNAAIQDAIYPLVIADVLTMLVIAMCTFFYMRGFAQVLLQLHHFLSEVSAGNLSAQLSPTVIGRRDELGDIGRSAITMQRSLRTMVEQDALTSLYNRRSGDRRLRNVVSCSFAENKPFCVSIGDIDFFKKVNDTYGHECGDVILKSVAAQLRAHMRGHGFVARWGGEEFLLVFENMELEQAQKYLEALLDKIRAMETPYEDKIIKVTMTFGLSAGDTRDITQLLKSADEKLYNGKTGGRNRVVI